MIIQSLLRCHRKMVASTESKQTYHILHISYTNSEITIGLPYIRPNFVWWLQLNNCATLVPDLPTYILVGVTVKSFWCHYRLAYFERCRFQRPHSRDFPFPCCLADSSCMLEAAQQHRRFSAAVWKRNIFKYWKLN